MKRKQRTGIELQGNSTKHCWWDKSPSMLLLSMKRWFGSIKNHQKQTIITSKEEIKKKRRRWKRRRVVNHPGSWSLQQCVNREHFLSSKYLKMYKLMLNFTPNLYFNHSLNCIWFLISAKKLEKWPSIMIRPDHTRQEWPQNSWQKWRKCTVSTS